MLRNITLRDAALLLIDDDELESVTANTVRELVAAGHVTTHSGRPVLTADGQARARRVRESGCVSDLKKMVRASAKGPALKTVGGHSFQG